MGNLVSTPFRGGIRPERPIEDEDSDVSSLDTGTLDFSEPEDDFEFDRNNSVLRFFNNHKLSQRQIDVLRPFRRFFFDGTASESLIRCKDGTIFLQSRDDGTPVMQDIALMSVHIRYGVQSSTEKRMLWNECVDAALLSSTRRLMGAEREEDEGENPLLNNPWVWILLRMPEVEHGGGGRDDCEETDETNDDDGRGDEKEKDHVMKDDAGKQQHITWEKEYGYEL